MTRRGNRDRKARKTTVRPTIPPSRLDAMIEEAIVDAYNEAEQAVGFHATIVREPHGRARLGAVSPWLPPLGHAVRRPYVTACSVRGAVQTDGGPPRSASRRGPPARRGPGLRCRFRAADHCGSRRGRGDVVSIGMRAAAKNVDEALRVHAGGKAGTMPEWSEANLAEKRGIVRSGVAEVAIGPYGIGCRGCTQPSAFALSASFGETDFARGRLA